MSVVRKPSLHTARNACAQLRVELAACALFDLDERVLLGHRRSIRPARGHRVERVRDREHARLDRDRVTAQAMWIALPVPALVVMQHVGQRGADGLDRLDQPRACCRMGANRFELVLGQRPGFREDPRRNGQLADVVQRAADPQRLDAALRPAQPARDAFGEGGDAKRMPARVRVARLDRSGEGREHARRDSPRRFVSLPHRTVSLSAASSRSRSVIAPAECVVQRSVTLR